MVIAVGDVGSTIIWTASAHKCKSAAEKVHFIVGGSGQEVVGTNALALSLKKNPTTSCVFSNEHYMESIHDCLLCSPVIDPLYSKHILRCGQIYQPQLEKTQYVRVPSSRALCLHYSNRLIEQQRQYLYIRAFSTPASFV